NNPLHQLGEISNTLFVGLFQNLHTSAQVDSSQRRRCPYTTTLHPQLLYQPGVHDNELFNYLLQDRLVLIGANITGVGDWVETPTHGKLPGVYLHAMALDNLIELGAGHARDSAMADRLSVVLTLLLLAAGHL